MILISFDVADGRQPDFKQILLKLQFKDHVGDGQNKEYLPESTMAFSSTTNMINLEKNNTGIGYKRWNQY